MRSTLESFPEEVLLLVFRHAVSPSWIMAYNGDVPWTRSMHGDAAVDTKLAIIHVDKTWHRVGLELLYRSIILYHVDQLPVLVQRLEERPDLAMHVRRVGLCYYLTPGWTKLHLEESANLLGLCPGVRSFSLGGVSEISPDFAFPIPVVPRHLLGSITELEVNSKHIEYKAIYPLLLDLAPTLHTLSIALPIEYTLAKDTLHPCLRFPRLLSLRLQVWTLSRVSTAHWALPSLRHLSLLYKHQYIQRSLYPSLGRQIHAIVEAYGPHLEHLVLPPLEYVGPQPPATDDFRTIQEMLDLCPALRRLGVNVVQCAKTANPRLEEYGPLAHSGIEELDVFGHADIGFRPAHRAGPQDIDLPFLRTGMPRLRICRYLAGGVGFLADIIPSLEYDDDKKEPRFVESVSEVKPPAGTWLEAMLSDGPEWGDEDDADDADWVDEDSEGEDGGDDSEDSMDDDEAPAPITGALFAEVRRRTHTPVDWEVGREEAIAMFDEGLATRRRRQLLGSDSEGREL